MSNRSVLSLTVAVLSAFFIFAGCSLSDRNDPVIAVIGKEKIRFSELEFALFNMPPQARQGAQRDASRRDAFRSLVETRIHAQAAKRMVGDKDGRIERLLQAATERDLTRIYQQFYLHENYGNTEDELLKHYRSNQAVFAGDTATFSEIRQKVAKHLAVSKRQAEVQEFFTTNKNRFRERNSAELTMVSARDSLQVLKLIQRIAAGESLDSVAANFSDAELVAMRGRLGNVRENDYNKHFARFPRSMQLVFNRETRMPAGQFSEISSYVDGFGKDTIRHFAALKVVSYQDAPEPDFASVRQAVEEAFLQEMRQKLLQEAPADLRKRYQVEVVPIEPPGAEEFYEKNKDLFRTQQAYRLLHVQHKDSLALAKAVPANISQEEFSKLAGELSQNKVTAGRKGELGVVKVAHAMPWGIGMMPSLFNELSGKTAGYRTTVLKAPDTQDFHVFFLLENIPPAVKPFDRARKQVMDRLKNSGEFPLDSNTVLATAAGKPIMRERDVLALREEVPEAQRQHYNRDRLLGFLADWYAFSKAARELKLDQSSEYIALSRLRRADMWATIFRDSVLSGNLGVSAKTIDNAIAANPELFPDATKPQVRRDAALWILIPDIAYRKEFLLHPERFPNVKDPVTEKAKMFNSIKDMQVRPVQQRVLQEIQASLKLEILDTSLHDAYPFMRKASEGLELAKRFYGERKLSEARQANEKVRDLWPADTTAFRAYMNLGQIHNEEERFAQAVEDYAAASLLWPQHPDAYKAAFMRGFLLAENLKQDSAAISVFRDKLKRFPQTDLTDDAEMMIKNIESGGKLVQDLLDSIAKADTATISQ